MMDDLLIYTFIQLAAILFSVLAFVFIIGSVYSSFLWVLSLWGFGIKMITCRLSFFFLNTIQEQFILHGDYLFLESLNWLDNKTVWVSFSSGGNALVTSSTSLMGLVFRSGFVLLESTLQWLLLTRTWFRSESITWQRIPSPDQTRSLAEFCF